LIDPFYYSLSDAMLKENLLSQEELSTILNELRNEDNSASYYAFPRQIQIAGMK